jgi:hypothetical protein
VTDAERLNQVADKQAITEALTRYCRGIDRADPAIMKSAFHEDAHLSHGAFEGRAWDFADRVVDGMSHFIASAHMLSNILIEVRGDRANAEAYVHAIHHEPTHADHVVGRYLDRLERRGGEWRIAHRQTVLVWTHRHENAAETFAPLVAFARSARGPEDPLFTAEHLRWGD